jgi:hypothetical protein
VLIFLAGVAFLLMLIAVGELAGSHFWRGGGNRYVDHCATCGKSYPRPAGLPWDVCPQGHVINRPKEEPNTQSHRSIVFIALCAGFIVVAIVLTAAGFVGGP